ncbi:MAG: hypothetical protein KGO82_17615 [Bacteroidota bacterium]|nr:hypothetical protein [Bacteroidota bacterium]
MNTDKQIEIPLSKGKLTIMLIGSVAFVAIGLWMVISQPTFWGGLISNQLLILITGFVSILFFGLCSLVLVQKLRSNDPGLIIDKTGITDNASGLSAGHIPWNDIKDIKISQVINQKILMIVVDNPNKYISRQPNVLKRKAAELNFRTYGSPISIISNSLTTNFDELKTLLLTQLKINKP